MARSGGRVQFLGRHLMVKGRFADLILDGRKTTTIRIGIVKPRYKEIIIHGHGRPLAKAEIVGIKVKKARELTEEDAMRDGFRSPEELIKALEELYSATIRPDTKLTIIEFRVKQRFDSLSAQDPYMGLEPADIARLGLRYLKRELGEEEAKILEDLTRTNSIRSTAIRLYGSIEKRARVRKVLRWTLKELLAKGLIKAVDRRGD
ncbi:MAG: ASCH domain-containing protein [Aeropyrum sp.]|nr:ASCH domain-containing protein [Aeropyrum sp.]